MADTIFHPSELRAYLEIPLQHAQADRGQLVPVIGAGVSRPLGLPGWTELAAAVAGAIPGQTTSSASMSTAIAEAKQRLPKARYEGLIQGLLDTPDNKTTLTHQALVAAGVSRLVTTNLDFSIERAFEMAGAPLRPENVQVSQLDDRGRKRIRAGTILYKIHGSLEEPSTWTLTDDDYDRAYIKPGPMEDWWRGLDAPLLFIGFSFSDEDISHSLRVLEVRRSVGAYALLELKQIREQQDRLKRCGITPIAYLDVRQIPELIDDIFRGPQVRPVVASETFGVLRHLKVGGAQIELPIGLSKAPEVEQELARTVANALEFGAQESIIDGQTRRVFGERGQFIAVLQKWIHLATKGNDSTRLEGESDDFHMERCSAVVRALLQYPDVLFAQLLPVIVNNAKINARLFTLVWNSGDEWTRARLKRYALQLIDAPLVPGSDRPLESSAVRALAIFLAGTAHAHPAARMPPIVLDVPQLPGVKVSKYVLTRTQVEQLRGGNGAGPYPIRPHTISSQREAHEIIELLNSKHAGSGRWRLPTSDEWEKLLSETSGRWPWGASEPERGVHAHLTFVGSGGPTVSHAVEVGTHSGDILGGHPLRDLIGNVYEVVEADGLGLALAGGGWTTTYKNSATRVPVISTFERDHKDQKNVGLRVVLESAVQQLGA